MEALPSPNVPADSLPRHLTQQQSNSAASSSNASPAGTPPATSVPTFASASASSRSPAASTTALTAGSSSSGVGAIAPTVPAASPGLASPASASQPLAPGSPSTSSSNRFSLNLGFIARRPRGWTTSSVTGRSPGPNVSGNSLTASPSQEMPPSPSGGNDRSMSSGYGFPALRRSLSKRNSSTATTTVSNQQSGESSRGNSRQRRSASQPPVPHGSVAIAAAAAGGAGAGGSTSENRPSTSRTASQHAGFPELAATTSLPNPSEGGATGTGESNAGASTSTGGPAASPSGETYKIRLVPHLESSRSLHFEPIERDLAPLAMIRIGRFTDRHGSGGAGNANAARGTPSQPARIAFKSKVVSRGHAEIWVDEAGKFHIRDTKSSSGTFLNHIRLAGPNIESRPFPLKDGDVLQLGVDYQGGTEEIYRCVKMRVELNRGWQRGANSFNTAALAQLRALGGFPDPPAAPPAAAAQSSSANGALGLSGMSGPPKAVTAAKPSTPTGAPAAASTSAPAASITDCCICLYPVTVCQALFIAPCSHVTHFKCIRPLVEQNYPGFCCPLCRTYADLEADVEVDLPEPVVEPEVQPPVAEEATSDEAMAEADPADGPEGLGGLARRSPPMDAVLEADEPASRAPSIRASGLARSRPPSIAPGGNDLPEEDVDMEDALGPINDGDAAAVADDDDDEPVGSASSSRENVNEAGQPAAHDFASSVPAMAIASPSNLPSHLSPPMSEDAYASLASAATPPNSTFLSTLAESATGAARSAATAVFGAGAGSSSRSGAAAIVPTSALARPPASLDAADLSEAGPSTVSLARSGSGSGTHGSDLDSAYPDVDGSSSEGTGEGQKDADQSEASQKGKGKGKRRSLSSSLFPPRDGMDHPDPAVAAALLI